MCFKIFKKESVCGYKRLIRTVMSRESVINYVQYSFCQKILYTSILLYLLNEYFFIFFLNIVVTHIFILCILYLLRNLRRIEYLIPPELPTYAFGFFQLVSPVLGLW